MMENPQKKRKKKADWVTRVSTSLKLDQNGEEMAFDGKSAKKKKKKSRLGDKGVNFSQTRSKWRRNRKRQLFLINRLDLTVGLSVDVCLSARYQIHVQPTAWTFAFQPDIRFMFNLHYVCLSAWTFSFQPDIRFMFNLQRGRLPFSQISDSCSTYSVDVCLSARYQIHVQPTAWTFAFQPDIRFMFNLQRGHFPFSQISDSCSAYSVA